MNEHIEDEHFAGKAARYKQAVKDCDPTNPDWILEQVATQVKEDMIKDILIDMLATMDTFALFDLVDSVQLKHKPCDPTVDALRQSVLEYGDHMEKIWWDEFERMELTY